jgi:hypothetical protein
MAQGETCFNISGTSVITSGIVRGSEFPFSDSFVDIIIYTGGVKLFLPLFSQSNPRQSSTIILNDKGPFSMQALCIFQHFFTHSSTLKADFISADGFKALVSALVEISPDYYSRSVLSALVAIWDCLLLPDHKRRC